MHPHPSCMWQDIHHQSKIVYGSASRHLLHSLPADLFVSSLAFAQTILKPWPRFTLSKVSLLVAGFVLYKNFFFFFLLPSKTASVAPVIELLIYHGQKGNWKWYFLLQKHCLDSYLENPQPLLCVFTAQVWAAQVFPLGTDITKTNESPCQR